MRFSAILLGALATVATAAPVPEEQQVETEPLVVCLSLKRFPLTCYISAVTENDAAVDANVKRNIHSQTSSSGSGSR